MKTTFKESSLKGTTNGRTVQYQKFPTLKEALAAVDEDILTLESYEDEGVTFKIIDSEKFPVLELYFDQF